MSTKSNFLDSEPSILEKNLRFVKNELEEEFEQMIGNSSSNKKRKHESVGSKIVKPSPGMCIKCYKVNTNEKFFINLCQTDGILPPENITEIKLHEILQSEEPSSYRIPMSISDPRITKDRSGNNVDVCDVAINPKFLKKCENVILFRDFLIAIILEALSEKYNIQLSPDNWIILKNRKLMGTLVAHRIQYRDIKTVYDSYKNPAEDDKKMIEEFYKETCSNNNKYKSISTPKRERKLIEELDEKEVKKLSKTEIVKINQRNNKFIINTTNNKAQYIFHVKIRDYKIEEIIGEFYVPDCISAKDLILDVGEDRIKLKSTSHGYFFDKFVSYNIDDSKVSAIFNKRTRILCVHMPLKEARKVVKVK